MKEILLRKAIAWQLLNIVNALILFVTVENSQDISHLGLILCIEIFLLWFVLLKSIFSTFSFITYGEIQLILRGKL